MQSHVLARLLTAAVFVAFTACSLGVAWAQPAPSQTSAPTPVPINAPTAATPGPTIAPVPFPTEAPIGRLDLDADTVQFLYNRYLIEADGRVRVKMGDGTLLTGDTFSMDLRLNRMVVAGHVRLVHGSEVYDGAGFAEFFDDDRSYFIPILSEPDRWTFISRDYGHPYKGRDMPADTFFLPNTTGEEVYLYASSATIWPRDALLFNHARVKVAAVYAPAGRIYFNFSANPNFHQNSLVGAQADIGYPFFGGKYAYTTLHARWDQNIKGYLGLEQHFAWDNAYIVASISPFDRANKQENLLASDRLTRNFQVDDFDQLNLVQDGWTAPWQASYFGSYSVTYALPHSFAKLTFNQYNGDLLAEPTPNPINGEKYYGNPTYLFDPSHPVNATLQWTGYDHRIGQLPLSFQLHSGLATYHNGDTLGTFNGTPYFTLWSSFYGLRLYTQSIRLMQDTYFTASVDKERSYYSLPHYLDNTTTTASLSRLVGTRANASVMYQVVNSGDHAGAQQLAIYQPSVPIDPSTGLPALGYAAFIGFATSRTLQFQGAYTPNPNFAFTVTYDRFTDFPRPIQFIVGRPPNYFNADVKMRLTKQISLELSRAYYFNWYGAKWAPQMGIQFGP